MEAVLEIILDIAEAFLEAATDKTAKKHGRLKACMCLAGVLILLIACILLGIHWVTHGNMVPGVLILLLGACIIGVFIWEAFRKKA